MKQPQILSYAAALKLCQVCGKPAGQESHQRVNDKPLCWRPGCRNTLAQKTRRAGK